MSDTRKFLVVADGSDESRTAAYFAARRARNTGGSVILLGVAQTEGGFEHWLGVGEAMRAEARESAEEALDSLAEDVEGVTGTRPELVMKEGELTACLKKLVEEDTAIAILVLGASAEPGDAGPLIQALARGRGLFETRQIPVTVVPGGLSRESIKALS